MANESSTRLLRVLLPHLGAPLYIGEQERDSAGGKAGHGWTSNPRYAHAQAGAKALSAYAEVRLIISPAGACTAPPPPGAGPYWGNCTLERTYSL